MHKTTQTPAPEAAPPGLATTTDPLQNLKAFRVGAMGLYAAYHVDHALVLAARSLPDGEAFMATEVTPCTDKELQGPAIDKSGTRWESLEGLLEASKTPRYLGTNS